jgi:hypothetical protein
MARKACGDGRHGRGLRRPPTPDPGAPGTLPHPSLSAAVGERGAPPPRAAALPWSLRRSWGRLLLSAGTGGRRWSSRRSVRKQRPSRPRATFAFSGLLGSPLIWRTRDHTLSYRMHLPSPLQQIGTVKSTARLFSGRHPVSSADSLMIKHCWLCLGCERSYNKDRVWLLSMKVL